MIHFFTNDRHRSGISSRREWLRIGGLAGLKWLGASRRSALAATGRATSTGVPGFGKARSIILVYTAGGQSQLETWDPKPDAPETVRGEFRPIATTVPGTFIGEHMPRLTRLANRYSIVRSLSHDDLDHGSAGYLALTGRYYPQKSSNPPPRPTDDPTYGALLQRLRPIGRFPYEAVHLNGPLLIPGEIGSAVLAGAGITRGAVYGGTDRFAAQPRSHRLGPWDVAATMFSALGVNPATEYLDPQGRPLTVSVGQPIAGLYQ